MHQVSMLPKASSPASARARAPSTLSRIQRTFGPEKYVAIGRPVLSRKRSWPPSAISSLQIWSVRVSCQTSALWMACPVERSHTTVVSRWFVMPMAARSPADRLCLLERPGDHLLTAGPDLGGVVLDPARLGEDLLVLLLVDAHHVAAVVEDHESRARRALVERADVVRHVGPPSIGQASPAQCRRRFVATVMTTLRRGPGARRCARPDSSRALAGHERDRGGHAFLRGLGGPPERRGQLRSVGDRRGEGVATGDQRVEHRLVTELCLSPRLHARHRGRERGRPVLGRDLVLAGRRDAQLQEQRAVERPAGAARPSRRASCPTVLNSAPDVAGRGGVELGEDGLEARGPC